MAITTTQSQQLYIAYFARPADPAGLSFWTNPTSTNTMQQQSNNFATSTEWTTAVSGMNTTQIVNLIYNNAFSHAPDAAGLAFWVDAITSGTLSVGDAAWQIVTNTGPADTAIVAAKVTAAIGYTDALIANVTDNVAYGNSAAYASASDWLNAITTSAQATAALVPAALDASLAAMVTASDASTSTTYNLTTSIDTINVTGSGINNVASGLMSQTAGESTLNTGDTINGNGLTTVSLIVDAGTNEVQPIADINNVASININLATSDAPGDGILNMAEFDGVAQVAITQGTNEQVLTVEQAQLDTTYAINIARSVVVGFNAFEDDSGATDLVNLAGNGAGNSNADATFSLNDQAVETVSLALTGTSFVTLQDIADTTAVNVSTTGATELTIDGGTNVATYTVTGSGANDIYFEHGAAALTIDASGTSGTNSLTLGDGEFSSTDTITGGSGADTFSAFLETGTIAATMTGVETLVLTNNASLTYLSGVNTTGVTTIDIAADSDATATLTAIKAEVTTINVQSEDTGSTDNLSVTYVSGSASTVELNLAAENDDVTIGDVTFARNTGPLIVTSAGDSFASIDDLTANVVTGFYAWTAGQSLQLNSVTVNAAEYIEFVAEDGTSIDANGAGVDTSLELNTGAVSTTITAIEIGAVGLDTAGLVGSTVDLTIHDNSNADDETTIDDIILVSDADGEIYLTITENTADSLLISAIDATDSAGDLTLTMSDLGTENGVEVTLGAGDSTVVLTQGADTVYGGAGDSSITTINGADVIWGGAGEEAVTYSTDEDGITFNDFTAGATGDVNVIDISEWGVAQDASGTTVSAGAVTIDTLASGAAYDFDAGDFLVLTGIIADDAALDANIELSMSASSGLASGDEIVVAYYDGYSTQIRTVTLTTIDAVTDDVSAASVVAGGVELTGINTVDLVAANFYAA